MTSEAIRQRLGVEPAGFRTPGGFATGLDGREDLQKLLLAEDLPTIPLYFRPNVTAASNRVANWKPEFASNGYTWNVWEWDLR